MHSAPRNDRGVVAIELVLVMPVLLMMLFLAVSMGSYFYARSAAADSARSQARSIALGLSSPATCGNPNDPSKMATVTVTKSYAWVVPFITWTPGPATATVSMRCGG
jgi:Flp pilus assembly protein TadG